MKVIHKIVLDLGRCGVKPLINAVQGDTNSREIEAHLMSNGTAWNVPENVTVSAAFRKPDGTSGIYDTLPDGSKAVSVEGNVARIILAPEVLTVSGVAYMNILFHDTDLNQLSTFPFKIDVCSRVAGGDVSNSYYQYTNLHDINAALSELDEATARIVDDWSMDDAGYLYLLAGGNVVLGPIGPFVASGGGGGAPSSYTISITNLLESRVITVPEGEKVVLRFTYASVDDEGMDDGPGIGQLIVAGTIRKTFSAVQGENELDVTEYLVKGTNNISVRIANSESVSKSMAYTVTVAAVSLTSAFDASAYFTGEINFVYTPTGIADKTMHFELDGKELETVVVTTSGRQQSYKIPAQSHGSHVLRSWFTCEISGQTISSNVLYYSIICYEEGNLTPIIAVTSPPLSGVEQFSNIVKKYRVYDPANLTAPITLEVNGEVVASLTVDRTEQTWTYRPMDVGELVQTIRCGDVYVSWTQTVTESSIQVEAETEALALHLSSYGRSNNEETPGIWESGNVACEFQNFNFISDGWLHDEQENTVCRVTGDARLLIPYKMFAYDFRTTGKTIEFELATRQVLDYDTEIINCFSGGRGFSVTAQQLLLASEQSVLETRYKENEHIRVTFVAEKKSENRLLLCYINGIMSGAVQYPTDDDFSQANPVGITIGSNECTTDLYNIRVYDNNLTRFQILDNWIADTQDPNERIARYLRNNIYDAYGQVVKANLPTDLGRLTIRCAVLPQYKGDKKTCSGYFEDLVHPERSFSFENAEIDVQGTSSQYYWRKNYKIKFKGGFILFDGTTAAVYAMNEDVVPVSTYTMKADVASSEGYYNVVSARLFNQYHPFTMPAQEADPRARYSIDGFPIVIFWDNGTETQFLGKYNFNHDKGTSEPFGLSAGDERWEVLQNGTDRVGFHSADFSDASWKEDFEGNYPDGNTDLTNLQPMCAWVTSTENDPDKFSAELAEHFVETAVIYYYVFTEAFLCMDQREKNVLWRFIGALMKWLADYYDADSIIGHNNQAQPVFDYWMEDIDYTASGDPVYNGQNSTFWKNLRETRAEEIKAEWHRLRDAGFSYESVMAAFAEHKSKWPEAIYNEDMQVKCLDALEQEGDGTYLPFLRGDKWAWTQQWLYKRFRYLDSKYEYGDSLTNRATIRTNVMQNITATYYMKLYGHCYYNAEHVAERVEKDVPCEFVSHASGAEDRVIGLNDADMVTDLGDLSVHQVELIDLSKMRYLGSLKLGDAAEDYVNNALTSVTFGNNTMLRKVDLRNCASFADAPDLSGCTNIEEVYLDGTAVTGLKLPNGGILKVLHLPETVANLTLRNQKLLTDFVLPSYAQITTLRLENNSDVIDPVAILMGIDDNSRVRIIGFNWEADNAVEVISFIEKLNAMRGLDENGNNVDTAQVSGRIHVSSINALQLETIEAAKTTYPNLTIAYDEVRNFVVQFYNGDTLLQTVKDVLPGASVVYTGNAPTKEATDASEEWRLMGWSPEPVDVQSDLICYAQFANVGFNTIKLVEGTLSGEYENDRVTTIGTGAFQNLTTLTGVSFPNAVSVGTHAFVGSVWTAGQGLQKIDLPRVTTLDGHDLLGNQFEGSKFLTMLNLPELTVLPGYAFSGTFRRSTTLTSLDFPKVTDVRNYVFSQMGMDNGSVPFKVRFRSRVVKFGQNVFVQSGLVHLILDSEEMCVGANLAVDYVYVPAALLDSYKAATNWSALADKFRALEDYTVDGTISGDLDDTKI